MQAGCLESMCQPLPAMGALCANAIPEGIVWPCRGADSVIVCFSEAVVAGAFVDWPPGRFHSSFLSMLPLVLQTPELADLAMLSCRGVAHGGRPAVNALLIRTLVAVACFFWTKPVPQGITLQARFGHPADLCGQPPALPIAAGLLAGICCLPKLCGFVCCPPLCERMITLLSIFAVHRAAGGGSQVCCWPAEAVRRRRPAGSTCRSIGRCAELRHQQSLGSASGGTGRPCRRWIRGCSAAQGSSGRDGGSGRRGAASSRGGGTFSRGARVSGGRGSRGTGGSSIRAGTCSRASGTCACRRGRRAAGASARMAAAPHR